MKPSPPRVRSPVAAPATPDAAGAPSRDGAPDPRGRGAEHPRRIPLRGWRDIIVRVFRRLSEDHVDIVAAGVTFYAFVALVPALVSLVSLYGLISDPRDVHELVRLLRRVVPLEVRTFLLEQLDAIVRRPDVELGAGLVVGLLFALWSASKGLRALIEALGIAYREPEPHGFFRLYAMSILATLGSLVGGSIVLALLVALPLALRATSLPPDVQFAAQLLRWPLLAAVIMLSVATLYRKAPRRNRPRWRWVSWGAVFATTLWLVGSILFSAFVSRFGSYDETYGSLGAIVVTLLWLQFGVYAVLLGAELNAEMEYQTLVDSTVGPPEPMGQRGAYVADNAPPDAKP
jgi:membrane protein